MLKLGFQIELDDSHPGIDASDLAIALRDALPREWWELDSGDGWCIGVIYPLDSDGHTIPVKY